ncbi:MAG: GyrI-like domain-containing protein [Asticcacaulis sp.]|uniref:GyrI-like domain-containing protein n=1 Tax=Asticcacaulis sp. TaxID=1872648 RepID=UPI0039E6DFE5
MIDAPEILNVPAQKIASIRLVIPASEVRSHITAGLAELRQVLAEQGIQPTGAWFTHHFRIPNQTFDFATCLPVAKEVKPQGRVMPGELRATRLARTVYRGNYDGLPHGWGDFLACIRSEALTMAGDFWEVYSVGPSDSDIPGDWQTQLNCPLA